MREQLRQQEAQAAAKKAAKELRSKGITVLDWPNGSWYGHQARPVSFLAGIDEQAHATEPCHAASVNPAGEAVAVCTDPSLHPRPEPSVITPELSPERQAEIEAERARRDALNAAAEARHSFLCKLLSQRIAKGEVLQHVSLIFVSAGEGLSWEDYEDAWGLLDVAGQEVTEGGDAHEALQSYAAGDQILDSTWSADWTRARVHLEFLQRHGYVLSEAERQELDHATAEEDAEDDAETQRGE